jgi:hypothetical protein
MDIGNSVQRAFDGFFAFLPNLVGFVVLLVVGFVVAKVAQAVVRKVLQKAGLDRHLHESEANKYVERFMPGASPSNGIARVVFWLVFVFFLFSAIGALKIPAVTTFMNEVLAYLPNVIAAIVIFVGAALISGAVAAGVMQLMGDTPTGKVAGTVLPAMVMVIALFMVLEQLQIAPEIVRIAFAATVGALALGLALAFGLGGRPVAQRMLEDAYNKGREQQDRVRADFERARGRAEDQAQEARSQSQGATSGSSTAGDHAPDGRYQR